MMLSTGLPELDRVFRGIMAGDNIVWQVDSVEDYAEFAVPYAEYARTARLRLVYFRFANHAPLLDAGSGAEILEVKPENGFEYFMSEIYRTINDHDRGTLYLFDCLSQLAPDWNSDRMLGNFFMLTCPHLYDRAAIAYFAIFRNYHSFHAIRPISNTTQILVDAYRRGGKVYIQPTKVQYRHSSTMYMLHVREEAKFVPVTQSAVITETLAGVPWSRSDAKSYILGYWSKTFAEAEELQIQRDQGLPVGSAVDDYFHRILRMLISRDDRVLSLAERYFTLGDLLDIRRRMIGTGLIGGKTVGMLLARAILKKSDQKWDEVLEMHDSFFVGADVFYTYLVQNGCWWMIQKHRLDENAEDETETARRRILAGDFPEYIVTQFSDMLDYFGQSPIIVRSSSILEDNFGNAFAGKYESVFCANQGGQFKRLEDFLCAVRTVYASTLGEEAIEYRTKRGLLRHDEQMGLLIQRVSGATYGNLFFPQAAGVGFSFNPYVWNTRIDPEAGVLRLVFGVGTRAVDRADDDYTRVVALNAPSCRPEADSDEVRQYAQRRVDVIDLETNQLTSSTFEDIVDRCREIPIEIYASRDTELERRLQREGFSPTFSWVLTFDKLLSETSFVTDMREMLATLERVYDHPVDVEFTLNFFEFLDRNRYKLNLVQCRPLQVQGGGGSIVTPKDLTDRQIIVKASGAVVGRSMFVDIDWFVYVHPEAYAALNQQDRYEIAHVIGEAVNHRDLREKTIMLLGPGRWGTTTPSLGVPVKFAEIAPVSVLCEIVAMRENLIPDVSLGTHFFNEMVENDMLYLALFPKKEGNRLDASFFRERLPNRLCGLIPECAEWHEVVSVVSVTDFDEPTIVRVASDTLEQRVLCYTV
jgi:pyruvate, water dikinase